MWFFWGGCFCLFVLGRGMDHTQNTGCLYARQTLLKLDQFILLYIYYLFIIILYYILFHILLGFCTMTFYVIVPL